MAERFRVARVRYVDRSEHDFISSEYESNRVVSEVFTPVHINLVIPEPLEGFEVQAHHAPKPRLTSLVNLFQEPKDE